MPSAQLGDEHFDHLCGPDRPLPEEGVISIVGPGTGLGVAQLLRRGGALSRHRDRGRPYRLRAARRARGPDPRPAADQLPPGLGRAGRLRHGPGQHLRGARRDRGPDARPYRDEKALWAGGDGRRGQPRRRRARPLLPVARARSPATSRLAQGAEAVVIAGGLGLRLAGPSAALGLPRPLHRQGPLRAADGRRCRSRSITHPQPGLFGAAAAFASAN